MFYRPHKRVTADVGTRSRTKQSHKDECDINNILNQYKRTGIITHVQNARASYEDLPSEVDFQQSLNVIMEAEAAFDALPAKVRDSFNNDPGEFLAAFQDDSRRAQLEEFGLVGARPEPAPIRPPAPSGAPQPSPGPSGEPS